jgi:hypothetical protein
VSDECFLGWIINSAVLSPEVYLLLQRPHRHRSSLDFKVVDSVAQGGYDWELGRCGFFRSETTKLMESANEG